MELELTGIVKWIFTVCVAVTTLSIIILGTWNILNYIIWQILLKRAFVWANIYPTFIRFIWFRKRFEKWLKEYKATLEEGVNE